MERFSWIVEMLDKMSGPARRITRSLATMQQGLHGSRNAVSSLIGSQGGIRGFINSGASGFSLISGSLDTLKWGLLAAGAAYVGLGYTIGKTAFENFAFKESALATGKALWGSAEAAQEMFTQASQLARLTPFNVKEVAGAFNKLGAAGFMKEEVPVVFQGLSDIAAMSGKGAEAIGSLTLAFSQIMGRGKLQGQELNQITEAAGGAVSRLKLFGEIAKIMGVAEGSIESMMENGLIPARVAIMGVMQVAKGLGDGVIGQNSLDQSKTLGGLWSNLEDTMTNLWLTMDLSSAPWFGTVKGIMSNIITMLDTSTNSGKQLQAVFGRLFENTIGKFSGLTGEEGLQTMVGWISKAGHAFEVMWNIGTAAFSGLWEGAAPLMTGLLELLGVMEGNGNMADVVHNAFKGLGQILSYVVVGMTAIVTVGTLVVSVLSSAIQQITTLFGVVGKGIGGGLGLLFGGASFGQYWDFGKELGGDLSGGFKDSLKIMSPSRVFEGHGENIIKGLERGADLPQMTAQLGTESTTAVGKALTPAPGGVRTDAGVAGGVSVALTIQVDNTGHGDGDSIAQRLGELLPSQLSVLFERMATEQGLA